MAKTGDLPAKIKWLQRFFKVAGNVAPASTLPILVKVLFTPKSRPLRPPHVELAKKAEKFKLKVNEFKKPGVKLSIMCYKWGTGNKLVLLVHGWDAKALDYYKLIPALVAAGYQVLAFDGPAHGESEGESTHLMHFRDVIEQLIQKTGVPHAIIGHSMGGGAATYFLMEHNIPIKRLVLLAIPIISRRYFEGAFDFMKIPARLQKLFFKELGRQLGEDIDDYNLVERSETIKADKILLVNDPKDDVINQEDVKDFVKARRQINYMEVPDAGHNTILKNKAVIDEILSFLK